MPTSATKKPASNTKSLNKKNSAPVAPAVQPARRLNIACLTHFYIEENRAGGELMLHGLLAALAKKGHNVTALITDTIRHNTTIDGVNVVYGADPRRTLHTYNYDVLISQFQNTPYALNHTMQTGKPFVHVIHNDMAATFKYAQMLRPHDLNIFNSQWIMDRATSPAPGIVVHPAIDRASTIIKGKRNPKYVTLVNLTTPKGSDMFYALARHMPDVQFMGVLGGYWKDRQQKISLPNVTIVQNTPDMANDVYANSKVVLMPSTYETFGLVAAEAIANGIPVIATPTDGLVENLGNAGVFVKRGPGDVAAWAEALRKLLTDDAYYNEMAALGLERSKVIDPAAELNNFVTRVEDLVHANV